MDKPSITYCGNIRHAANRAALLDLAQVMAKGIADLPAGAFEPVEGRRQLRVPLPPVLDIPDIHMKAEPAPKRQWPSSSRQRFGGKR